MSKNLFERLSLPCGSVLKNRLVKAAMEENMADDQQLPDQALFNLYQRWSSGDLGLLITGNVMVDHLAMTGPGGVVLEVDTPLAPFKQWAQSAKQNNTQVWMQINHPGRQVFKRMGGKVLSPSDIALNMGKHSGLFGQPQAMDVGDIEDVISRFVCTALRAQEAGFDGVEIHAAHGYLLAQFLSPLSNKRTDEWGGPLKNRARMLLQIVQQVREATGHSFAVAVKLNSADFQRGGFDVEDALQVVLWLEALQVDVVELSGGSYEAPAMQGQSGDERTLAREAYFLEFARNIASQTGMIMMTTGGIKRQEVAQQVVDSGIDLVGMASALAYQPDLVSQWQHGCATVGTIPTTQWKDKTLKGLANMALVKRQLRRIGNQQQPKVNDSAFWTLLLDQFRTARLTKRYRKHFATELS